MRQDFQGACTGTHLRDGIGWEVGEGFGMGDACVLLADLCRRVAKANTALWGGWPLIKINNYFLKKKKNMWTLLYTSNKQLENVLKNEHELCDSSHFQVFYPFFPLCLHFVHFLGLSLFHLILQFLMYKNISNFALSPSCHFLFLLLSFLNSHLTHFLKYTG